MTSAAETIFALSSGHPPAGVAVIRLSGPGCRFVLETSLGRLPPPRRASLRAICDTEGRVLDQGVVLWFPGPQSFTGEDAAELQVHGGRAVVAAVLRHLGSLPGLRLAEPGEFSRRAFLAGRMDLTEIEGLADLIAAETELQRRQALRQMQGGLRSRAEAWRSGLIRIRALVEAELDFVDEEDVGEDAAAAAWPLASRLASEIRRFLDDGGRGEKLRRGLEVVLAGPPNAGKSSLLNALARRDVAIVTAEPGTTRDLIEVELDLGGHPVRLVDTAGLREAGGAVEREGIRRAVLRGGEADLVLWLVAPDVPEAPQPEEWRGRTPACWIVETKADLVDSARQRLGLQHVDAARLAVSTATGEGIGELTDALQAWAATQIGGDEPAVTRERQRQGLVRAVEALDAACVGRQGLELRAEALRQASEALASVTGAIGVEDVLGAVFAEFCIGK